MKNIIKIAIHAKLVGVQFLSFPTKSYTNIFSLELKNWALILMSTGRSTLMNLKAWA